MSSKSKLQSTFKNKQSDKNQIYSKYNKYNPNLILPMYESVKIAIVYGIFGLLWIYISDYILLNIIHDKELLNKLSMLKGWLYVLVTMIFLLVLIKRKLSLLKIANNTIHDNYAELSSAYDKLKIQKKELKDKYNEIQMHRDALMISEEKYRLAIEGANDGIWEWDIEKGYYFSSIILKEHIGYKREDFRHDIKDFSNIIHFEDKENVESIINRISISDNENVEFTFRIKTKDNTYRWILNKGRLLRDGNGKITRAAGSHTDITNQIQLQELLQKEKDFSEGILNNAASIIIVLKKNGEIANFNKFAELITGFKREEVIGLNWSNICINDFSDINNFLSIIHFGKLSITVEKKIKCKNNNIIDVLWNNNILYNKDGSIYGIVMIGNDVTEKKKMEDKLFEMAHYDSLTKIPNRAYFEKEFIRFLSKSKQNNTRLALLYFDVDNFKYINDTIGHFSGDKLLIYIADILKKTIEAPNLIARLGGDEFAIILVNVKSNNKIIQYINKLYKALRKPWKIKNQEFLITVSMGIALYPEHSYNPIDLLKFADSALYEAKKSGKSSYRFYDSIIKDKTLNYINMVNDLRQGIKNNQLVLYYQPLIDLRTTKIIGVEVLTRWIHPKKGMISPVNFIPIAEETGIILEIDKWVLENACIKRKEWEEQGYGAIKVSVNLSSKRLKQKNLSETIERFLIKNNLDTYNMQLEITETAAMDNYDEAIKTLEKLKDLGFTLALDDFGNGYSSINYLMKLPIDTIKIDREYIKNILNNKDKEIIVRSLIGLAHDLELEIVAEGIESYEQKEYLKLSNCDIGQGYLFGKPMPENELLELLKDR